MNKILEDYDLFCFDFDGLLVNSEPLHQQAYNQALSSFNLSNNVDFLTYCGFAHHKDGSKLKNLYQSLFDTIDDSMWKMIVKHKQTYYSDILAKKPLTLMPGAEKLIKTLLSMNKSLCVVTNSQAKHTLPFRKAIPILNEIPIWITKDDVAKTKPHPDGFIKALVEYAEVPMKRAIGLDDALKGITAIENAGITPLLVCDEKHPQLVEFKPDVKHISSLEEILA